MSRSVALAGRPSQAIGRRFDDNPFARIAEKIPPANIVETRLEYTVQFGKKSLLVADLAMAVVGCEKLKIDEPLARLLAVVRTMRPEITAGECHRRLFSRNDEQTWLQQLTS